MRDDGYGLGLHHNPGFSTETVVIWSWLSLPWKAVHAFKGIKQHSCLIPTEHQRHPSSAGMWSGNPREWKNSPRQGAGAAR